MADESAARSHLEAYLGTWTGSVSEAGVDAPYRLDLTIFEQGGRVFQNSSYGPPLRCRSGGVMMSQTAESARFGEIIVTGRTVCADGTFIVYPEKDGSLLWEWFYLDGDLAASATLKRSDAE